MSVLLKRLAVAAVLAPMGACTLTPVDLLIPAGVALVSHISESDDSGAMSVSKMLKRVRGEPETPDAVDGPVSVEEMLARARGEEAAKTTEEAPLSASLSVEQMLANARAATPSETPPTPTAATALIATAPIAAADPAPMGAHESPPAVTLADLRAQVMGRALDAPDEQVCR